MQTAGNQRKKSQPSTKALTMSGSALFLCAKPTHASGALKFRIAAQLRTMEPEGEMEVGLCTRRVNGNGPLALDHQEESVRLARSQFLLVVCL